MYDQILADIANYKIKGAVNVCKWGVLAFSIKAKDLNSKCSFISTYLTALQSCKTEIISIRSNEVALINSLNYVFDKKRLNKFQSLDEIKEDVSKRLNLIENYISFYFSKISDVGSKKIKDKMTVYTHGHSSLIQNMIEEASRRVKFKLNITDSFLPAKDFVQEISFFVKVTYYPFYMVENIVLDSDIILLGCTAIKGKNVLCPGGSQAIVSLAKLHKIPVYVVTNLLKYSSENTYDLESFPSEKIFPGVFKGIEIVANALDLIDGNLFDGFICEQGILDFVDFQDLARQEFGIK